MGILSQKPALSYAQSNPISSSVILLILPFSESWVEAVALKQFAFSSWKENELKATSDHSTKPATSVCLLSGEPDNNICPISRMKFQTCLPPLKPGGTLASLSPVYAPLQSLPSFYMAPQPTPLKRRPNASILCLLQYLVSLTPPSP